MGTNARAVDSHLLVVPGVGNAHWRSIAKMNPNKFAYLIINYVSTF